MPGVNVIYICKYWEIAYNQEKVPLNKNKLTLDNLTLMPPTIAASPKFSLLRGSTS
jgi:hypothetical protein